MNDDAQAVERLLAEDKERAEWRAAVLRLADSTEAWIADGKALTAALKTFAKEPPLWKFWA